VAQPAAAPAPAPPVATGAAVEIVVPAAGESITSANVAAWRKKDGDFCEKGEILVTLETDKVSNELEAPVSGKLQILVHEGEVSIGKVIGMIAPGKGAAVAPTPKPAPLAAVSESRPKPDLSVLSAPKAAAAPAAINEDGRTTRRKMSMLRRKIATHLVNAQQTAAILTTFNEVDMTAV
ncbi:MAG: biotin/lipoyl-containing protein, partial [bacterium]